MSLPTPHVSPPPILYKGSPGDSIEVAPGVRVTIVARAKLPTRHGLFEMVAYHNTKDAHDHVALVRGDLAGGEHVPTRLHSECLTGDVFGSLKCDCGEQLDSAIQAIASLEAGVILYLRQEGRGIGLANKIRAYALQDQGMDTVEANLHLGFDDDLRQYDIAAGMLHLLGIRSIQLFTNNPRKIQGLRDHGVSVAARSPLLVEPNRFNQGYLQTKEQKSGHMLAPLRLNGRSEHPRSSFSMVRRDAQARLG